MTQGQYLAAAYLVVFAVVLAYMLIIGLKLVRLQREVGQIALLAADRDPAPEAGTERAPERQEIGVG